MKIVHLAKYYLPHLGGVEIHLKEINSLLIKMGHEVVVITQQHNLKLSDTTNIDGVKIIRIPKDFSGNKKQTWKFMEGQIQIFAEADIVHIHDVFWWILPVYKMIKQKVFITFHGWEAEYPVKFNAKAQRYLYSKLARGSIHVGAWIQQFYFDKPDQITYGAINAKRLTKSRVDHDKTANEKSGKTVKINLTFVGRLSKDNEVEKYLDLVSKLKTKGHDVEITWVGDGALHAQCAKLGKVTGFVKNISKYLVGRDFVFSSSYLSILEAQLLGNNVCAFYSNKLKKAYLSTFPGNEFMLIAGSVNSMIKKITFILQSPKSKKQLGVNAAEFAKKQTWTNVLDLYLELWSDALKL